MTQVISVVQEKGGAGKTTLLTSLVSLMVADGAKVAVVDTDPQRHLESWAAKGKTDVDWHYEENDELLIPAIKELKKNAYDAIFVDTAGFKSAMSIYAINAASLVLIPCKACEADAIGAVRTHSHVLSVGEAMDRVIPTYVVLSDIDSNTNMTRSLIEGLEEQNIPRLNASLDHRTGFKEMLSTGILPSGAARRSAQQVLANLQLMGLIEYYKGPAWQKSA